MIKNIIFDLGGVVIEWNPQRILDTFTGNPALATYFATNGFSMEAWDAFDRGLIDERGLAHEVARVSGCLPGDCLDLLEHVRRSLATIPETEIFIELLVASGYRVYCLSNMSVEHHDYLKTRPVFRFFDGQVISGREGIVKPERAFYELILNRYRLLPHETLFIDDLSRNVEAAAALGIHAVHFAEKATGILDILVAIHKARRD